MINQSAIGLNSRSEANPYYENGFLPIITAPMYSVVDESNYQVFLDNKIQVCLPRNTQVEDIGDFDRVFFAMSLEEFIVTYIEACDHISFDINNEPKKVCIDTANGNMPALHDAIRKAKEIHGDKLIIMAGNVGSSEAFVELAKTGVDYVRCGIGGGGGCNTTSNTGVGNPFNLGYLITHCRFIRADYMTAIKSDNGFRRTEGWQNIAKVKIVADGISSWIKFCEKEYGYNDNGYAAINELLFAGADLVMVGKLFAQCLESAGEKRIKSGNTYIEYLKTDTFWGSRPYREGDVLEVKYSGMSTQQEQKKYKSPMTTHQLALIDFGDEKSEGEFIGEPYHNYGNRIKPSEGSVQWIPIRFLLREWIKGNSAQDSYPFLMGFENALKSAMSYRGAKTLKEFKNG